MGELKWCSSRSSRSSRPPAIEKTTTLEKAKCSSRSSRSTVSDFLYEHGMWQKPRYHQRYTRSENWNICAEIYFSCSIPSILWYEYAVPSSILFDTELNIIYIVPTVFNPSFYDAHRMTRHVSTVSGNPLIDQSHYL